MYVHLVVWGTTDRVCLLATDDFSKAKVGHLDVPILVEQQVLWLEVSVQNAFGMQVLQCQQNVGGVEPGSAVGERPFHIQVVEQLAPWAQLKITYIPA